MSEELQELKLYSPLSAEILTNEAQREMEYFDAYYLEPLVGGDLVKFRDTIEKGIAEDAMPEEAERGLMNWYGEEDSLNDKVHSMRVAVEEINGRLYGVAVCEVRGELTPAELIALKSYCTGQYADGWGENFEQRERRCAEGEIYVHFWQPSKFFICTEQEMQQNRQKQQRACQNRGDEVR